MIPTFALIVRASISRVYGTSRYRLQRTGWMCPRFGYPACMHLRSRPWRALFLPCTLVLAACSAWAAGCTDEAPSSSPDTIDGGPKADTGPASGDGGDGGPAADTGAPDGAAARDCTSDADADGLWKHLECSGLYSSFADKTVSADAKPYKPAVEFWSDGAAKSRWIYLPPGAKIDISNWNEWSFPAGTKVWKEFKLGGKRIETRLFTKLPDKTWSHTTYRWTADESDAARKDGGELIAGLGPDGGTYEVPSAGQCDQCHMGRADRLIGFDAVSLGQASATGETLAKLATDGLLSQAPPATTLSMPGSATATAALAWVQINCGMCHNGNPGAAASFRSHYLVRASQLASPDGGAPASLQELDIWQQAYCYNTSRTEPDAGVPYKYIRGGSPERSLMSILSGQRVPEGQLPNPGVQMPPIVTRAVDHQGHALLDDWISSLPPCN